MHSQLYQYARARGLTVRAGFAPERAQALLMLSSRDGFVTVAKCGDSEADAEVGLVKGGRTLPEKRYPLAPSALLPAVQNAIAREIFSRCGVQAFAHFLLDTAAVVLMLPVGPEREDVGKLARLQDKHEAFWSLLGMACEEIPGWDAFLPALRGRRDWLEAAREQARRIGLKTGRISLVMDGQDLAELNDWHTWWAGFYDRCARQAESSPWVRKAEGLIQCVASGQPAPAASGLERLKCFGRFGADPTGMSLASTSAGGFVAHGYKAVDGTGLSQDGFLHVKAALEDLCARRSWSIEGLPGVHLCWSVVERLDDSLPDFIGGVYGGDVSAFLEEIAGEEARGEMPLGSQQAGSPMEDVASSRRALQVLRSVQGARLVSPPDEVVHHLWVAGTSRMRIQQFKSQPMGVLHGHLQAWFRDLRISLPRLADVIEGVNPKGHNPYGMERLLRALSASPGSRSGWPKTLPPQAQRELADAAFFGKSLSGSILDAIVQRCFEALHRPHRLDAGAFAELMDSRIALLKLCLIRAGDRELRPQVNPAHSHPAYQLGRLLALCAAVQRLALGPVQASLAAVHFRSLATRPTQAAIDRLVKLNEHHLAALRRHETPHLAFHFKAKVGTAVRQLQASLPRRMGRNELALYLLGFYQEAGTEHATARRMPVESSSPDQAA